LPAGVITGCDLIQPTVQLISPTHYLQWKRLAMPSSCIQTFTDPDEYAAAMRQAAVRLTPVERGSFKAKLSRIELHRLWMQRFSASLGWTSHIDYHGGQVTFAFQTHPGPSMIRSGRECALTSIAQLNAGQRYYLHSHEAASYGTLSLPVEDMILLGAPFGRRDLTLEEDFLILTPRPPALAKLRRLHEVAGSLAEDAPAVLASIEGARGLEQALFEAMMNCLHGAEPQEDRAAMRQHAVIMRRFHQVIERRGDQPIYLPELCREVGASARTLQACCQEHLGMSPKRYLLLRRMHMVRRALSESGPAETTVTEIATRYGFWQFGRLAVEYKALFGEVPSATLARPG
jgi:AraC-like DNA-binding protein